MRGLTEIEDQNRKAEAKSLAEEFRTKKRVVVAETHCLEFFCPACGAHDISDDWEQRDANGHLIVHCFACGDFLARVKGVKTIAKRART